MTPATTTQPKSRHRTRRTQEERTAATTGQLVKAARRLFARDGYADTSLAAVADAARVTKGAFYHHFTGKRELFEAVFAEEQRRLCEEMTAAYAKKRDPWAGFAAGSRAFVEACLDPGVQQITLIDGPSALGYERLREIQAQYELALMKAGLEEAMKAKRIRRRSIDPLANVLYGGLCQAVAYVAQSDDQNKAMQEVQRELKAVLDGLEI